MKIARMQICNYRSIRELDVYPQSICSLIGQNGAGKSNILKALELFFEASKKLVDDECFHGHNTDAPIRIVVTFRQLSDWEKLQFAAWMLDSETLVVCRDVTCDAESSYSVETLAILRQPNKSWLQQEQITGDNVTGWWSDRDNLKIGELDFAQTLGTTKPKVGEWKAAAAAFVEEHADQIECIEQEVQNPKGYPNVLKGVLPQFIYVPAVRNIIDEAKVTQSNPFGKLLNSVLAEISEEHRNTIANTLQQVEQLLNRTDEGNRIQQIQEVESKLNTLVHELMDCEVEIELPMPKLREVFSNAKLFANDGIRTQIDTKGHGLQRSLIFTILRAYAEFERDSAEADQQRSTVFAIEEPELYLHPQAQRTFMSAFRQISQGRDQIVYTTHSSHFVDIGHFDEIAIMSKTRIHGQPESTIRQLFVSQMLEDLYVRHGITGTGDGIREQYLNVFNSFVNEGFFAEKVVVVEGASEGYSLPIYSSALGFDLDRRNVSVVYADGKGQMDRLVRIFSGFQIPFFIWFDGDKDNHDEKVKRKTMELLQLLGVGPATIDQVSTIVGTNHAVMENHLEAELMSSIADYAAIVAEGTATLGPMGKPLKNKWIAQKLAQRAAEQGNTPQTTFPPFIIQIVNALQNLGNPTPILRAATT